MKQKEEAPGPVLTAGGAHHPSRDLTSRSKGYGIAAGYEKKRVRDGSTSRSRRGAYSPLPHSGYYGAGLGDKPFKLGQAGFSGELSWYRAQYGETTSGLKNSK